jgi:hypothetical protein
MLSNEKSRLLFAAAAFAVAALVSGCVSTRVLDKGDAELWGENCSRCHNASPSSAYSAEQLQVIGQHMRLRAGLTQQETERIVKYLSESN